MAETTATTTGTTTIVTTSRKFDTGSITKLNSTNYRIWKMRMENLFTSTKMKGIVIGSYERPIATATLSGPSLASAQNKWDSDNSECVTTLLICMEDAEVDKIAGCKTAYQIWSKLATIYESTSLENKQSLWQKFFAITASDEKSPVAVMTEIQSIASQLKNLQVDVDNDMITSRVITSLMDDKYRNFREAWRSVETDKQTPELLLQRLKTWELDEEHASSTKTVESSSSAFHAKFKNGPGSSKKPFKGREEDKKKKTKCFRCKNYGHWKADCPVKFLPKKNGNDTKKSYNNDDHSAYAVGDQHGDHCWINDSGADCHYCGVKEWFDTFQSCNPPEKVKIADGYTYAYGIGNIKVKALQNKNWNVITLTDVRYIPGGANLFSERVPLEKGLEIRKSNGNVTYLRRMVDPKTKKVTLIPRLSAKMTGGLQIMEFQPIVNTRRALTVSGARWHERLSHCNVKYLQNTAKQDAVFGLEKVKFTDVNCDTCIKAKSHQKPYTSSEKDVNVKVGEILHMDLVPATIKSTKGNKYYLLVKDEASGFRRAFFQKTKDETENNILEMLAFMETNTGNKVRLIRSDRGTEFTKQSTVAQCKARGTEFGYNSPGCSASNGFIERDVRTVMEASRAMLIGANLPQSHWEDAVGTSIYMLNRTLNSRNLTKTPYELVMGRKPSLAHVKVFGCKAFAHILDSKNRWTPRVRECILVGYNSYTKDYVLFEKSTGKYYNQIKHVTFREDLLPEVATPKKARVYADDYEDLRITVFPSGNREERNNDNHENEDDNRREEQARVSPKREIVIPEIVIDEAEDEEMYDEDTLQVNASDDEELFGTPVPSPHQSPVRPEPVLVTEGPVQGQHSLSQERRQEMERPPRVSTGAPVASRLRGRTAAIKPPKYAKAAYADEEETPRTYREARNSKDWREWQASMEAEIQAQISNGTWSLVERPKDRKVLKNTWVFKVKRDNLTGEKIFKSRLCCKGYSQVPGIDFQESFAPVARYESVRTLLAIAAHYDLKVIQYDVSTAFLNSVLPVPIYMEEPEGFKTGKDVVCELHKGLYGLKDASRLWHDTFKNKLSQLGLRSTSADPCVSHGLIDGQHVMNVIYVDDGFLLGKNESTLESIFSSLCDEFKMKKEPLKKYLGIQIQRDEKGIFLHQEQYIESLLEEFGMLNCKAMDVPMIAGLQLQKEDKSADDIPYQSLIGKLLFLSRCTRVDIAYAVSYLSRFLTCYGEIHWRHAKNILRYLAGTKKLGILYKSGGGTKLDVKSALTVYADADHCSDVNARRSTTGVVVHLNNAPIHWLSRRQNFTALSSMEAEYHALAQAGKEIVWFTRLLENLGFPVEGSIRLYSDSMSAIQLAHNPEHHELSKHIDIRAHFIRDLVEDKIVSLHHLRDEDMPSDLLTKAVAKTKFYSKRDLLGMIEKIDSKKENTRKRHALSSVVVVPKRSLFYNMMLLMMMFMAMTPGIQGDKFQKGASVVWRKMNLPVVTGFTEVNMQVQLVSPCSLLPQDKTAKHLQEECERYYDKLFFKEMLDICPYENSIVRRRRVAPLLAGAAIAGIGTASVGVGGYAFYKFYDLGRRIDKSTADIRRTQVDIQIHQRHLTQIRNGMQKIITDFAKVQSWMNDFKEESVQMGFVVSYIMGDLMHGKQVISLTKKMWREGRMEDDLFAYLNLPMPCENCSLHHGIFHKCSMSKKENIMQLEFALPNYNAELTMVKADPFTLIEKKDGQVCTYQYMGPKIAVISQKEDCIYSLHDDVPMDGRVPLLTSDVCNKHLSFEGQSFYEKRRCDVARNQTSYAQVKVYDDQYHVYCNEEEIFMANRKMKCPAYVFKLPLQASFMLNNITYNGTMLKVAIKQGEDPVLIEQTRWHLTPEVNWENLSHFEEKWSRDEKEFQPMSDVTNGNWIWILTGLLVAVVIITFVGGILLMRWLRQRGVRMPEVSYKKAAKVDDVPALEMKPLGEKLVHHIVLEN